jgi:hypothetical protein
VQPARALVVLIPTALLIGCSLIVDTSSLSGEGDGDDAAPRVTGDASPESSSASGDATVDVAAPIDAADASDGATSTCPTGRGPDMVRLKDTVGTFCIDKTEVTDTQFNVFLADSSTRPTPPAKCSYRTTYGGAPRLADALPVTNVDWCEAWMFCAWAGKRLCGSRNGTPIDDSPAANDPSVSEWHSACTHGGDTKYSYGDVADKTRCNGCDRTDQCDGGTASLVPVASLTCEGGYPGIFDMIGNVGEWEDNCDNGSTVPQNTCPLRGGDRTLVSNETKCAVPSGGPYAHRQERSPVSGIRCCAN